MNSALFVAWRSGEPTGGRWGPVGKLEFNSGTYRFTYTQGARSLEGFQPFPGMRDLETVYESDQLFPIFANRILSASRPEYEAYLTWGGFDPSNPPDPLAILGVTEGIRQTDSLEVFPCPAPGSDGCFVTKFFLHGIRWASSAAIERISRLQAGESLYFMFDVLNEFDAFAAAVRTGGASERHLIGYVPRYLARDVRTLYNNCNPEMIELNVERLNPAAPLQMRVLCRLNACWPSGFRPCSHEDFQPIVRSFRPLGSEQVQR